MVLCEQSGANRKIFSTDVMKVLKVSTLGLINSNVDTQCFDVKRWPVSSTLEERKWLNNDIILNAELWSDFQV